MTPEVRLYTYAASFVSNYDGDTATLRVNLGYNIVDSKKTYRLYGINTPEVNRAESREAGIAARDYLRSLLAGRDLIVDSIKDTADKYGGRWLGVLWAKQADGSWINVNDAMIASGHAVPYKP